MNVKCRITRKYSFGTREKFLKQFSKGLYVIYRYNNWNYDRTNGVRFYSLWWYQLQIQMETTLFIGKVKWHQSEYKSDDTDARLYAGMMLSCHMRPMIKHVSKRYFFIN